MFLRPRRPIDLGMGDSEKITAGRDGFWSSLLSLRNLTILILAVGVCQIAAYWLFGMFASSDGSTPIPQPDTLLYCQAARRIVEGHPFSYSAGTAVSTGTTSVLLPFLLAIPYALGCTGNVLLTAGFWLNAAFYLIFLVGWTHAFGAWLGCSRRCLLACLVLAAFGQTAFSAFAQSDIGLWLATSALLAVGLATRRFELVAIVLLMGPWVRPEGMVCVIAFILVGVLGLVVRGHLEYTRREWILAGCAFLSMMGVFALNYALTGRCQFSSVANKGHLINCAFPAAVFSICEDFIAIFKRFFLGLEGASPRDFLCFPLWGGILIGLGAMSCRLERLALKGFTVFALACLGGVLTVAQSGWQGTNLDRYLAWIVPLAVFLLVVGASTLSRMVQISSARWVLAVAILSQAGWGAVGCWGIYSTNCGKMEASRHFMLACDREMPKTASVGGFSSIGLAYGLGERRAAHLGGIYSPEFTYPKTPATLEDLKHNPNKRFDYWLVDAEKECTFASEGQRADLWGEIRLLGPNGLELREANWSAYDYAAVVPVCTNRELVARVDVGYPADEMAVSYRTFDRYARRPLDVFALVDKLNGKPIVEAGRLIVGGDEMMVPVQPGRDLTVVMRTLAQATAVLTDGVLRDSITGKFGSTLSFRVAIGDSEDTIPVSVACPTNGFADVSFTIPGGRITSSPCRLALLGDHVACGYWFYQ